MKKFLTTVLSLLLIFNSVLTVNIVKADEELEVNDTTVETIEVEEKTDEEVLEETSSDDFSNLLTTNNSAVVTSITQNDDGDITIVLNNSTYLSNIESVDVFEDGGNYFWICVSEEEGLVFSEGYTVDKNNNSITIDFGFIEYIGYAAGTDIGIKITTNNEYEIYAYITLTKGAKSIPEYTIGQNDNGDIVISSEDTDFISAIARPDTYDYKNNVYHYGSEINMNLMDGDYFSGYGVCFYNQKEIDSDNYEDSIVEISISQDGKNAIISRDVIEKYIEEDNFKWNVEDEEDSFYYYSYELNVFGYGKKSGQVHVGYIPEFEVVYNDYEYDPAIYIYSFDEEWLQQICDTETQIALVNYITFLKDGNDTTKTLDGNSYTFEESQNKEYDKSKIIITGDTLKDLRLEDGTYQVKIGAEGYKTVVSTDTITVSGYCLDAADVDVTYDEKTHDLVISSSNRKYITALCKTYNTNFADHVGVALINKDTDESAIFYNFDCIDFIDTKIEYKVGFNSEGEIVYSVIIKADTLETYDIDSGTYDVKLFAPGYQEQTVTDFVYVDNLKTILDNATISVNADGDVVVSGLNSNVIKDWKTSNLSYFKMYRNYGEFWYEVDERLESSSVIANEKNGTLTIKKDSINSITTFSYGEYSFELNIAGYKSKNFGLIYEAKEVPSDLKIACDKSGNLTITTKDTNYLNSLVKIQSEYDSPSSYVYCKDNDDREIYNVLYYDYGVKKNIVINYITLKGTTATIQNKYLKQCGWQNGENTICVAVDGYEGFEDSVELTNVCVTEAPALESFTCEYKDGKGLVITCEDRNFIKGVTNYTNRSINGGSIEIETDDGNFKFYNYQSEDNKNDCYYYFKVSGKEILIPEVVFVDYGFVEGEYDVNIYSVGYPCVTFEDVAFPTCVKECPDDIEITRGTDGDLIITSEDQAYLNALGKTWDCTSKTIGAYDGGEIYLYNGKYNSAYYYNEKTSSYSFQDLFVEKGKLIIPNDTLKLELQGTSDTYYVTLEANGYKTKYIVGINLGFINSDNYNDNYRQIELTAGDTRTFNFNNFEESVSWSVSDDKLATIDENGNFKAYKAGTVYVYASGDDDYDSIKIVINKYEAQDEITTNIEPYINNGIEVGDSITLEIFDGQEKIDNRLFDIVSSNTKALRYEDGELIAGQKGSTTLDIYYGGTKTKVASYKISVLDKQVREVILFRSSYDASIDEFYLNSNEPIDLGCRCLDKYGEEISNPKLTYKSSDSSIAVVTKDGKVTIKKPGQFTITVSTTNNDKLIGQKSDSIAFRVLDYTPSLESDKVTVNRLYSGGTNIGLYAKYDDEDKFGEYASHIKSVSIPGNNFEAVYSNNVINFKYVGNELKNKTYNEILKVNVETESEETYTYYYALKLSVVATTPKVSVKTLGSYNTFTGENTLSIVSTIEKGYESLLNEIAVPGGWATINPQNGSVSLTDVTKTKGVINYWFAGYIEPVSCNVTFKTVSTAPKCFLETSAVTVKTKEGNENVTLRILNSAKQPVTNGSVKIDTNSYTVNKNGEVTIPVSCVKNSTLKLNYRDNSWTNNSYVPLTLKVTTTKNNPTIKLSSSTISLNKYFCREDGVDVISSMINESITGITYSFADKKLSQPEGLTIELSEGRIVAVIDESVPVGSYKYQVTPKIGETSLKPLTLTIKVDDSLPQLVLKKNNFSFNNSLYDYTGKNRVIDSEIIDYEIKNPYNADLSYVNFYYYDAKKNDYVPLDLETDIEDIKVPTFLFEILDYKQMVVCGITPFEDYVGKFDFCVGVMCNDAYDSEKSYESRTKVSVTFYKGEPSATFSFNGSLNQFDISQKVTSTLKVSNFSGEIDYAEVTDKQYGEYFDVNVNEGKVEIYLSEKGAQELEDGTYKIKLLLMSWLTDASFETYATVKVARKAPTIKLDNSSFNVYDTTTPGLIGITKLSGMENAQIGKIELSNSEAFNVEMKNGRLEVYLKDGSKIKAGSTTKLTIKVYWMNDYGYLPNNTKAAKPSTINITVKDCSQNVKCKQTVIE